jgi:hypothetical protein
MRLLLLLEDDRESGAIWYANLRQSRNLSLETEMALLDDCVQHPHQAQDGTNGADYPEGLAADRLGEADLQRSYFALKSCLDLNYLFLKSCLDFFDLFLQTKLAFAHVSLGGQVRKLGKTRLELIEGLGDQTRARLVVLGLGQLLVESQRSAHLAGGAS